jgi:hypothetical protein
VGAGVNPCCATVTVWPATVTAPSRADPLFAAIDSWTEPVPLAAAPSVTLIHEFNARAVQPHPFIAETPMRPPPPPAPTSTRVVSRSNRHGAPSCETSSRVDCTVNAPRRSFGVPFAATRNGRVASP